MATLAKELSPERCLQLREQGVLRLMVNLLHDHTFEPDNKSEADFSIELFLMDFNQKAERRDRISKQIRKIVEHTVEDEHELGILSLLAVLRMHIEDLYSIMDDWKSITEDANTLNKCTDRLTKLAGIVKKVFEMLGPDIADDTICLIFKQFGGVFVMVDYLRAQTRFNTKCHQFDSDLIDSTQLLRVANDSKPVLQYAVVILHSASAILDSNDDIRLFLGRSRSLHEIMVGIAEDAYNDGHLFFVEVYCQLLYCLSDPKNLIVTPGVRSVTSHLKDCGVIEYLAKIGMNIKDPKILYLVLETLAAILVFNRQNVLEFVSIDGAVDMLIDVLVPSKEKDEDVENAEWYEGQRHFSTSNLFLVSGHFSPQDRQLWEFFESRDLVVILVRYLEKITLRRGLGVLVLLRNILECSEDQHRKFAEMVNGKEVVKRFETSDDDFAARVSKQIGEMFE